MDITKRLGIIYINISNDTGISKIIKIIDLSDYCSSQLMNPNIVVVGYRMTYSYPVGGSNWIIYRE